jgi:hypothetical protein
VLLGLIVCVAGRRVGVCHDVFWNRALHARAEKVEGREEDQIERPLIGVAL